MMHLCQWFQGLGLLGNQKIVAQQCLMPLLRFPTCGNLRQIQFNLPLNEPNGQAKRGLKKTPH